MAKVQDTYNPITGEYVKKISDWLSLDGSLPWLSNTGSWVGGFKNLYTEGITATYGAMNTSNSSMVLDFKSKQLLDGTFTKDCKMLMATSGTGRIVINPSDIDTGFNEITNPTQAEVKAYFYGYKLANSDGTSPYYKSEVPYTPATWAEWTKNGSGYTLSNNCLNITSDGATVDPTFTLNTSLKNSTKYGVLINVLTNNINRPIYINRFYTGDVITNFVPINTVGNIKCVFTTKINITNNVLNIGLYGGAGLSPNGSVITIKDIRIFELPTGSKIEADFTNLTADELTAKYTFNGLCVKNWKKVTDGTGLTSTLPTATYAGYTPYKMIYQLATPEISYLTPKASIPLYDTNTIVETDTPSDCKADVTVGYKLKSGTTAVAGDITAPTPDYSSAVNSVSEGGLGKGIVRSPNMVENGNFANGTTGWFASTAYGRASAIISNSNILSVTGTISSTSGVSQRLDKLVAGRTYYLTYSARVTNSLCVQISETSSGTGTNAINQPAINTWYTIKKRYTATSDNLLTFYHAYSNAETAKDKVMELRYISVIDLTATFGAGNEPTQEQCDILFATWQDKASTQANLPTLRKIGTVADTYNPETGVLVQRIGKKVFDGTEAWVMYDDIKPNIVGFYHTLLEQFKPIPCYGATTHFKFNSGDVAYGAFLTTDDEYVSINTPHIKLTISKNKCGNLNQFKAYLAQQYANGTPVTVYYQLATPVVTTLTKTALPTYKPTTVIESDSTIKGNVSADYKLKANATPVAGDFIASHECVNDIKDLGNSIDVVSSNKNKGQVDLSAIPYNTITNGTYKTNILLSNPLRSVGAVKDRLFKDSDGKWKVERNVGEKVFDGTEDWNLGSAVSGWARNNGTTPFYMHGGINSLKKINGASISNNFKTVTGASVGGTKEEFAIGSTNYVTFRIKTERIAYEDVSLFKTWLANNPTTVQYELATPTYETLSQELQTDLDNISTFPEHNYVYTVTNDNLQPTLHVDYKKLSWLKSRLLLNSLKIYSRNLTDAEMVQNYKVEKERFGM